MIGISPKLYGESTSPIDKQRLSMEETQFIVGEAVPYFRFGMKKGGIDALLGSLDQALFRRKQKPRSGTRSFAGGFILLLGLFVLGGSLLGREKD